LGGLLYVLVVQLPALHSAKLPDFVLYFIAIYHDNDAHRKEYAQTSKGNGKICLQG